MGRTSGRQERAPRSRCRGVIALAVAAAALASLAAPPVAGWLALGSSSAPSSIRGRAGAVAQRRLQRLTLYAEGEEAAAAQGEEAASATDGEEAAAATDGEEAAAATDGEEAAAATDGEEAAATEEPAPAPAPVAPLFQEVNVSTNSSIQALRGALVAIFNKGERAVDLVLIDPRMKQKLLYAVAAVPEPFQASAQVLLRRRDRRLRVRVLQKYRLPEDEGAQLMRVAKTTNSSRLGSTLKDRFVDAVGNNRNRTLKLQFNGAMAATVAILAMEDAMQKANRELTFVASYLQPNTTGVPADEQANRTRTNDMLLTVIAS